MARAFFAGHNYLINLSEGQDGTEHYQQMFAFLRQSRINHALSHAPVISEPYLLDFWTNARHIKRAGGEVIRTRVANQEIEFSADDLRVILNLGTVAQEGGADGLTVYDRSIIQGGLRRMGFSGDLSKSTLFKKGFFGRWRYLAHVLLVGLSNKKTGWDTLNQETQAQMVGLVYNKPYSFSKFFFNEFRKQISARGTTRFLMYPRFVMMIINDRLPNLPVVEPVRRVTTLVKRSYNEFISRNANDPNAQDVELFGAIVNIHYLTPSDEAIASFDDLPAAQPQQQPRSQQEVIARQLNVMLDEQAVNPTLAQAVIHEVLQEHAPVNDPLADIEAYHDAGVPEEEVRDNVADDSVFTRVEDQGDRGKGVVDEGEKSGDTEKISSDESESESSDSDNDDEPRIGTRMVRMGSKMVLERDSTSSRKRKETVDADYIPEEEEATVTPNIKRARVVVSEPATSRPAQPAISPYQMKDSVPRPITPTLLATPFQFQLNDLNNKLTVMEGSVRSLAEEMENQKKRHEKELSDQKVKHLRDMNLMNMRIDRLNADLERERARNTEAMGKIVSTMADELVSNVSRTDMEALIENFLMKKGLIPDLGCKEDEMLKRKDDDENDDPDTAKESDKGRSLTEEVSKAIVVSQGESAQSVGEGSGKEKAPAEQETPAEEEVLFVKPLKVRLTTEAVDRLYMDAAAKNKKSRVNVDDEPGFDQSSSFNKSRSSDHDRLLREIQIKYGHDKILAENVYADLIEREFLKETTYELSKKDREQYIADSLSSSDSEYVPEKDK